MEHSNYYLYIVILSFVATYPVRSIPALFISKLKLSPYWQKVWDLVPYTALTALVFPGIFNCIKEKVLVDGIETEVINVHAAAIGTVVAIVSVLAEKTFIEIIKRELIETYHIRCDETRYANDAGFSAENLKDEEVEQ